MTSHPFARRSERQEWEVKWQREGFSYDTSSSFCPRTIQKVMIWRASIQFFSLSHSYLSLSYFTPESSLILYENDLMAFFKELFWRHMNNLMKFLENKIWESENFEFSCFEKNNSFYCVYVYLYVYVFSQTLNSGSPYTIRHPRPFLRIRGLRCTFLLLWLIWREE